MKKDEILKSHEERQKITEEARGKNIVDVAHSLGMNLIRNGRNYYWDQHDSFVLDTRKNIFYWNSQQQGGDSIKLVRLMTGCSFKEAIQYLTSSDIATAKIEVGEPKKFSYFLKDHRTFNTARKYLHEQRQLSNETIDFFLSKSVLAQSSYRDYETKETEPVIVFKALDQANKVKGMTVQGIWKQEKYDRGYLKKTHGDGFVGMTVHVGNPPAGKKICEENPLKVIAFEAPIDLMSYYELFNQTLDNAILVSMNGLRKGTISKLIANQLGASIKENEKPDFLDNLNKRMRPNKLVEVYLAVDNDAAGVKFVNDFDISCFKITPHVPKMMPGETKSDWNQVLQRLKEPEKEKKFEQRINRAAAVQKAVEPVTRARIDPVAPINPKL